jgi:hypothetical protein
MAHTPTHCGARWIGSRGECGTARLSLPTFAAPREPGVGARGGAPDVLDQGGKAETKYSFRSELCGVSDRRGEIAPPLKRGVPSAARSQHTSAPDIDRSLTHLPRIAHLRAAGSASRDPFCSPPPACLQTLSKMAPRAALLAAALLALIAPIAAEEWKFCAPGGGHCHCFGEMRWGHPGTDAQHSDDGAYFKDHPEVTMWSKIQAKGDKVLCDGKNFDPQDPFPGVEKFCQCNEPAARVWKPCAGAGEVCECEQHSSGGGGIVGSSALVRSTDDTGAYFGVQAVNGTFTCPADYPGAKCECLEKPDAVGPGRYPPPS